MADTIDRSAEGNNYFNDMFNMFQSDEMQDSNKGRGRDVKSFGSSDLLELVIKKSRNSREYKRYHEIVSHLILDYYKRLGNVNQASSYVYTLVENATDINDLIIHQKALIEEGKEHNGTDHSNDVAKSRILNILLDDYKRRFQGKKADAYNVLVLQSWASKVDNTNELAVLMDSVIKVRDRLGNSWDYETHLIPIMLEKSFNIELLSDYSNITTNLVIGLSDRLKDNYLAVMTAVKIMEFADSPRVIKAYLRDLVKEANKELDQLNTDLAIINSSQLSRVTQILKVRELNMRIARLNKLIEELMSGVDPKELMLESKKPAN